MAISVSSGKQSVPLTYWVQKQRNILLQAKLFDVSTLNTHKISHFRDQQGPNKTHHAQTNTEIHKITKISCTHFVNFKIELKNPHNFSHFWDLKWNVRKLVLENNLKKILLIMIKLSIRRHFYIQSLLVSKVQNRILEFLGKPLALPCRSCETAII